MSTTIKEIAGEAKVYPYWRRMLIHQDPDGTMRMSISYDEVCDINGKLVRDKMPDILIDHSQLVNDPVFPSVYPQLKDYVRGKLKEVRPEYFEAAAEESEETPTVE